MSPQQVHKNGTKTNYVFTVLKVSQFVVRVEVGQQGEPVGQALTRLCIVGTLFDEQSLLELHRKYLSYLSFIKRNQFPIQNGKEINSGIYGAVFMHLVLCGSLF